jgi:hypothetical protein
MKGLQSFTRANFCCSKSLLTILKVLVALLSLLTALHFFLFGGCMFEDVEFVGFGLVGRFQLLGILEFLLEIYVLIMEFSFSILF